MEPQLPTPGPSPEAAPAPAEQASEQQQIAAPEAAPSVPTPEKQSDSREGVNQGPGVQLPQPVQPPVHVVPQDDPPAKSDGKATVVGSTPTVADDVDVIEKEWVDKAKEIVERNKDDPHEQNKEVNALKADYMKKRYNKDVKVQDS